MEKFCQNCGASLTGTVKFCTSCGTPIPAIPEQLLQPDQPQDEPLAPKKAKKPIYKRWWFWLIIVLVVSSVAIIARATYFSWGYLIEDGKLYRELSGEFYLLDTNSDYASSTPTFAFKRNGKVSITQSGMTYEHTYVISVNVVTHDTQVLISRNPILYGIFEINAEYDTLTSRENGNVYVKKSDSGNNPEKTSRNRTSAPPRNLQPVSQQQVEEALFAKNTTVTILSHDIDSLIDSVSYRAIARYEYMTLETTGVIAFEYNPDSKQWRRYEEGDSILTEEEKWDLNGSWTYYEKFEPSKYNDFIDFKIDIHQIGPDTSENHYPGVFILCDIFYEGCLYNGWIDTFEENLYSEYLQKGKVWDVDKQRFFEIGENWYPSLVKASIYIDAEKGVCLRISLFANSRYNNTYTCERIS